LTINCTALGFPPLCGFESIGKLRVFDTSYHRLDYLSSSFLLIQPHTLKINASPPIAVSGRDASLEQIAGTSFWHGIVIAGG
jgi:hypothetical protein